MALTDSEADEFGTRRNYFECAHPMQFWVISRDENAAIIVDCSLCRQRVSSEEHGDPMTFRKPVATAEAAEVVERIRTELLAAFAITWAGNTIRTATDKEAA